MSEIQENTEEPKSLEIGTRLVYAYEDAGRNLPHLGLALVPGETYVVGEDFDGEFGQRLLETGTCRLDEKPDKSAGEAETEMEAESQAKEPAAPPVLKATTSVGAKDDPKNDAPKQAVIADEEDAGDTNKDAGDTNKDAGDTNKDAG